MTDPNAEPEFEFESELTPLFEPTSVAIVGASPDSRYASRLIDNLLEYGYSGDVYFVNPNRDEAWGEPCYDSLADLPAVIDLVVVSVPRQFVVDVVAEAGALGVPAAVIISAGFSEADDRGRDLEAELQRTIDAHGIRVCGPNCIGLANMHEQVILTSTCTRQPIPGSIGLVSQSGALAFTTFYERARDEDIDFAYIVSTGNEVDLSVTDYVEYMSKDPRVDVVCAYIEGLSDPHRFMRVAKRAVQNGTPVLVVKIGRSDRAEVATLSHTGSLTGNDAAWDAAFRQAGVERVEDVSDLISRAAAHAAFDPPATNRVCITSTSGGLGSLLADMADARGVALPPIADETEQTLLDMEELLTFGELHNPADIRGYGADVFEEIAEVLLHDETFDAFVFAFGLSGVDERADDLVDDLIDTAEKTEQPTVMLWTGRKEPGELSGPQPLERLRKHVPVYYDPSRCMDALASLIDQRERTARLREQPRPRLEDEHCERERDETMSMGEHDSGILTWEESSALLAAYGITTVRTVTVESERATVQALDDLSAPIVLKVDSTDIPHRTDVGAVQMDIRTEDDARDAYRTIVSNVHERVPDADVNGLLAQPQIEAGVEVLIGVSYDDVFGSIVTVGSGGTLVETLTDSTHLIPPYSRTEARDALARTRVLELLEERRNGRCLDEDALLDTIERIGHLAADHRLELDLNPVTVTGTGVHVIDVLVNRL